MLFAVSLCHIVMLTEGLSASKVTILWRYRNECIIIMLLLLFKNQDGPVLAL